MKKENKHFVVILGARPNFVKAAAFFDEAKKYKNFTFTIIHTGQHFDDNMSKVFFEQMNIPKPDYHLDIQGTFHTEKIGKMFTALKEKISSIKPYGVIVFGDVNSTLAGAIASVKSNSKLIHIESGLRSHDRRMPEEINRAIIDHLSDVLFVSEPDGMKNLEMEGIEKEKTHFVGNIMIDSMERNMQHIDSSDILKTLSLKSKEYIVATIHRQENTDDPTILHKIFTLLDAIAHEYKVLIPLHPGTKSKIEMYGLENLLEALEATEPLGYFEFTKLIKESKAVITDSGGIQEETTHLGVACCTLRDNTERPITVTEGTNMLFNLTELDVQKVTKHIEELNSTKKIKYWDNKVSNRILDVLAEI